MVKKQFRFLIKSHSFIVASVHEFFHVLMAFILNVEIKTYKFEADIDDNSWRVKGNIKTYSNNCFKHLLVNIAPLIFTTFIMIICVFYDCVILYLYLSYNLFFGNFMPSEQDWINAEKNFKNNFKNKKYFKNETK